MGKGLVSPDDHELYLVTDDVDEAVRRDPAVLAQLPLDPLGRRSAGGPAPLPPTAEEVAALDERFSDLLVDGAIEAAEPLPAEVADRDELELPRLVMRYDARRAGRLRGLIDAVNELPSANR